MIVAENAVPVVDGVANHEMRDVIGNRDDNSWTTTLAGRVHALEEHVHSASKVWPTEAAGVAITAGAIAWDLGAGFTEIVPNAQIGSKFDIHYVSIENLDTNAVYELVLYAIEVEIGRCRFTKNAVQDGTMNVPMQTPILPAGTQIQAKLADSAGGSIATVSLFYHEYV